MPKALGKIINAGMKEVGEPEVTSFDANNILQQRLIEVANNAVRGLVDRLDYDWLFKRTTLSTTDDINADSAAVTKDSTTVTSVDSGGVNANSFTGAAAGMYFRASGTQKSYLINSVNLSGSPHTVVLETAYLDTTSASKGYRIFQDTYAITDADFDFGSLSIASYGDSGTWSSGISGLLEDNHLDLVTLPELYRRSGGDPHRDTSGRPILIAPVKADSSSNPQFKLWPFPTDDFLIELWYIAFFTENTTFATNMFGGDAPESAYDYVEHKVVGAAHKWDEAFDHAAVAEQEAEIALMNVIRRENREKINVGFNVETYRRSYGVRYPTRSGITFDTVRRRG